MKHVVGIGIAILVAALAACSTPDMESKAALPASSPPPASAFASDTSFPTRAICLPVSDSLYQLTQVDAELTASDLVMTWRKQAPIGGQQVLYSAMISNYDEDGNGPAYQVGIKFVEGSLASYFVFDLAGAQQVSIPSSAPDSPTEITGTFPRSLLPGIEDEAQWVGYLSVDGNDVSECTPNNLSPTG